MKMKGPVITGLLCALWLSAFSVQAVEKNILVRTTIDPTLEVTLADGTPLPENITLQYNPVRGLQPVTLMTRIYTNDTSQDINVSLQQDVACLDNTNTSWTVLVCAGATVSGRVVMTVDLNVIYGEQNLNYKNNWGVIPGGIQLKASDIFLDNTTGSGASKAIPLTIAPINDYPEGMFSSWQAGTYRGTLNFLFKQITPVTP